MGQRATFIPPALAGADAVEVEKSVIGPASWPWSAIA